LLRRIATNKQVKGVTTYWETMAGIKGTNMDWQKILRCYIQHIVDQEGYDFLDDWRIGQAGAFKDLTEDERKALIELADNL
jgi:hypothetical protein